jgi:hypothetical protein
VESQEEIKAPSSNWQRFHSLEFFREEKERQVGFLGRFKTGGGLKTFRTIAGGLVIVLLFPFHLTKK